MKKFPVLLLALSSSALTYAQERSPLRFGVKAGGNLSHIGLSDNSAFPGNKNAFGFGAYGGGLLEISGPAGSKFKGQVEALFSYHNAKQKYTNSNLVKMTAKTDLAQISVPIMIKYFVIPQLSFNAGGSVNFNVASRTKTESVSEGNTVTTTINNKSDIDRLQTVQVGALVGATYYIHKGFFVDARYNYYFGSMFKEIKNNDPSYRLSAIQLGVGYKF
ncbi:outer membrane beta-barrel protein [Taibaiella chishuiensis]|uniref:Outer membrane protein with beta-barrel domain n=1 Tax=Taibaiella chishuiensis TaxID=1434707 RepID=A0A2P8DBC7_9BACT|nr:outer membrane beta-barrel protein [Taibaiella chishuiensis]PSK94509.1 outer membrane protein with beta-barrel domain [Taibaiella chishuiensis]